MLENRRSDRGVLEIKEKVLFTGALVICLLATLLWYNYIHRTVLLPPQSIFEQTFIEPIGSVIDLEGGNNLKFGFDYWIRFRSTGPIHLRYPQQFRGSVAEVGRHWFAE